MQIQAHIQSELHLENSLSEFMEFSKSPNKNIYAVEIKWCVGMLLLMNKHVTQAIKNATNRKSKG